jgi:hypothetical protein
VNVYDLVADPGESRSLFDVDPARADPALAELRASFAAHTRRKGRLHTAVHTLIDASLTAKRRVPRSRFLRAPSTDPMYCSSYAS